MVLQHDKTGIKSITYGGSELLTGTGMYWIGSCDGANDGSNITSHYPPNTDQDDIPDGIMYAPGSCPGSPFKLTVSEKDDHTISFQAEFGPAVADYEIINLPFDFNKTIFQRFRFDGNQYEVGCAGTWGEKTGSSGFFEDIPTPCFIESIQGPVGKAKVSSDPKWGEIISDTAVVRIDIISSSKYNLKFTNHPFTNNIEIGFGAVKKGESVSIQGEIIVNQELRCNRKCRTGQIPCDEWVLSYKKDEMFRRSPALGDALISFDFCHYNKVSEQDLFVGGRSWTYDQSIGSIAFNMSNEKLKANRILAYTNSFQNFGLSNFEVPDGSFPFSFNNTRLIDKQGVGDCSSQFRIKDNFVDFDYIRNGTNGWIGYAFILYQRMTGNDQFLESARLVGDFLITQQIVENSDDRFGLIKLGKGAWDIDTWEFFSFQKSSPFTDPSTLFSTEHNIDCYFFLRDLGSITTDERYQNAANQIKDALMKVMWNEERGRFNRGYQDEVDALDCSSWGAIFLRACSQSFNKYNDKC